MSVAHMCAHSYSEAIKQSLVYWSLLFVSKEAKQHITVFQGFCLVFGSKKGKAEKFHHRPFDILALQPKHM